MSSSPTLGSAVDALVIRCDDCGATLTLPREQFAAICPYCASPSVVDRPAGEDSARRETPDFILGFHVPRTEAIERVTTWLQRGRLFTIGAVKQAKVTSTRGIYLPAWIFSAVARSQYRAKIGENYTTTETYTTTDSKGRSVTRTRTVTKTEWRSLSGEHAAYINDLVVTASRGLGNDELETIEPFDLRALMRYDAAVVSGWAAEEATLDRDAGDRMAREEGLRVIEAQLANFLPGDSSSLTDFQTQFHDANTDLVMLPIWVFAARYQHGSEERTLRVLVNGQTGEVQGELPRSVIKMVGAGLVVLAVLALVVMAIMGGVA